MCKNLEYFWDSAIRFLKKYKPFFLCRMEPSQWSSGMRKRSTCECGWGCGCRARRRGKMCCPVGVDFDGNGGVEGAPSSQSEWRIYCPGKHIVARRLPRIRVPSRRLQHVAKLSKQGIKLANGRLQKFGVRGAQQIRSWICFSGATVLTVV